MPFPGLHNLEEVHGAPHRDRRGREVIRYEQLHRFVQVHTFAVATITGGSAPVQVAHHVGQPGVARGEQPAAHGVTERPPEKTLAAPHLRDHGDDLADLDPLARREAGDAVAAELSLPRERDALEAGGGGLEAGVAHELGDLAVATGGGLRLDRHLHSLLEGMAIAEVVLDHFAEPVVHRLSGDMGY